MSSEKKLIVTTVSTASAEDSRQMPVRWLEIAAARPNPATTPITVLMPRSTAKSATGSPTELSPVITTPASASARAAPVGIVERGLGHYGLGHLGPQARADEQRDQDRGVGGSQHRTQQRATP